MTANPVRRFGFQAYSQVATPNPIPGSAPPGFGDTIDDLNNIFDLDTTSFGRTTISASDPGSGYVYDRATKFVGLNLTANDLLLAIKKEFVFKIKPLQWNNNVSIESLVGVSLLNNPDADLTWHGNIDEWRPSVVAGSDYSIADYSYTIFNPRHGVAITNAGFNNNFYSDNFETVAENTEYIYRIDLTSKSLTFLQNLSGCLYGTMHRLTDIPPYFIDTIFDIYDCCLEVTYEDNNFNPSALLCSC